MHVRTGFVCPLLAVLVDLAVLSAPVPAQLAVDGPPAAAAYGLRGGGSWRGEGRAAARPAQRWDVDLTRADDGTIGGVVTLTGSPLAQRGVVSGRIDGRRVTGSIADPEGNHVATFIGTLTPAGGMRGTYQDRTGETGRWSWSGPSSH
jgi:hypothetical protein